MLHKCFAEALEGRLLLSHSTFPNPPGTPWAIPATGSVTIQAENYDLGGEGVAYHDLTGVNQGGAYRKTEGVDIEAIGGSAGAYAVDYTQAGEWMEYTTKVAAGGSYTVSFRVASGSGPGGTFHLNVDGVNVTGTMVVPPTTAWNTYATISRSAVKLTAGQHVLRLVIDSVSHAGYAGNFDWMKIAPTAHPGDLNGTYFNGANAISGNIVGMALQSDGKIILSGNCYTDSSQDYTTALELARYTSTGAWDSTFGRGGEVKVDFSASINYDGGQVVIQPNGKILVAGSTANPAGWPTVALTRFNVNGSLDTTFGPGGTVIEPGNNWGTVQGLALQRDAKIVLVESTGIVYRYNSDGKPDTSFGKAGSAAGPNGAAALALAPDGKIVVAGRGDDFLPWVARFSSNGSPDATFGKAGVLHSAFGKAQAWFYGVAVQGDGRVLATGYDTYAGLVLARYNANGTYDTGFGTGGMVSLHPSNLITGQSILPQSDGKIIVVGDEGSLGLLARYTSKGVLDSTFGSGGVSVANIGGGGFVAGAMQTSGNIIAVNGNGGAARFLGDAPSPTPFSGVPIPVSSNIQCEDFDTGGQGLSFYDTTIDNLGGAYRYTPVDVEKCADTGGGYDVSYTKAGEWLQYTVSVATARTYSAQVRLAALGTGGKFNLLVDGVSLGSVSVPSTGDWGTWKTISAGSVSLTAGTHTLRLVLDSNGASGYVANFNWMKLS